MIVIGNNSCSKRLRTKVSQLLRGQTRTTDQRSGAKAIRYGPGKWVKPANWIGPTHADIRQLWRNLRALNVTEARRGIETAKQKLQFGHLDVAKGCYGDLLALHATMLALEDDTQSAAATAEQALRYGSTGELGKIAASVLRYCAWKAGVAPQPSLFTSSALETAGALRSTSPGEALADVIDLTLAAAIEFSGLDVPAAESLARCALSRSHAANGAAAMPGSMLARILYEQGQIGKAKDLVAKIGNLGSVDCLISAYTVLARTAAHEGDRAGAYAILHDGCETAEARDWPRLLAALLAERIWLCVRGDEERASLWLGRLRNLAEQHRVLARCAWSEVACHLCRAEIYTYLKFRIGVPPLTQLAHLRHDAWLAQDLHASAWVTLAESQMLWAKGDEAQSLECFSVALRSAKVTGLRQQLMDAGPLVSAILQRFLCQSGVERDLLAFAICVADDLQSSELGSVAKIPHSTRSGETLTARERDVLKLIGEGLTNKVIAKTRGVTPETVKTHVKNIFVKLGVERRAQAVAKAQRLGLIRL